MPNTQKNDNNVYLDVANRLCKIGYPRTNELRDGVDQMWQAKGEPYFQWLLSIDEKTFTDAMSKIEDAGIFPKRSMPAPKQQPQTNVRPIRNNARSIEQQQPATQNSTGIAAVKVHASDAAEFKVYLNRDGVMKMAIEVAKSAKTKNDSGHRVFAWYNKHVTTLDAKEVIQMVAVLSGFTPCMYNYSTKSDIYHNPPNYNSDTWVHFEKQAPNDYNPSGNFLLKIRGKHEVSTQVNESGLSKGKPTGEIIQGSWMVPVSFMDAPSLLTLCVQALQITPQYSSMSATDIINIARVIYAGVVPNNCS